MTAEEMNAPDPMLPQPARITQVLRETHDCFTLDVAPGQGEPLLGFQPGQFSMLYVFGVGEVPISISGDPESNHGLTYTIRSVGAATRKLVNPEAGEWIGVRGPFGAGWPLEQARGKDVVLVAGGIGLAPLRPVLYHLLRHRDSYGRVTLLYGARSPRDILYRRELRQWARQPDTQVLTAVDFGGLSWRGDVGVVTRLLNRVPLDSGRTIAMACGPEIMMRYVAVELESRGVALEDVYVSMERNMKCAVGFCGHCQFGPAFICKDGPVFPYNRLHPWIHKHEI